MSQLPLHPLVVHFPIVLACLMPPVALLVAWGMLARDWSRRAWMIPLSLQIAVCLFAWAALALGEADEERVEGIVTEQVLETHEAWGERFLVFSVALMVLAAVPLVLRARPLPLVVALLSLTELFMVFQVGHSGARVVYGNGSLPAAVFGAGPAGGEGAAPTGQPDMRRRHDEDDDD